MYACDYLFVRKIAKWLQSEENLSLQNGLPDLNHSLAGVLKSPPLMKYVQMHAQHRKILYLKTKPKKY